MRWLFGSIVLMTSSLAASPALSRPSPFGIDALSNTTLADIRGTYSSPGFARNARAAIDQGARVTFEGTASINRVTLDNWFAREGAELLAAQALGRPLVFN